MDDNTETKPETAENILVNNTPKITEDETLLSNLARIQSQSPISLSGSDSAPAISASMTPLPINPIKNLSGPSLGIDQVFNDNKEIDEVNNEEKAHHNSDKIVDKTQKNDENNNENSDKMDIDEENESKKSQNKINSKEKEKEKENDKNHDDKNHDDIAKTEKIAELQEILDKMENTRLELIPLLLDNVEQVKNGELSIKDLDNACGRIRVRLNKLQESRNKIIEEFQILQENNNGVKFTQRETETRIKLKNDAVTNIINSILSRSK